MTDSRAFCSRWLTWPTLGTKESLNASYETVVRRWPIIITGVIDDVHQACHLLSLESQKVSEELKASDSSTKSDEGKEIIAKISKLKYQMGRDHPLDPIPDDGGPHITTYNNELMALEKDKKNTWFTAPWLFAEYRLIRSFFAQTEHWGSYDPFKKQKVKTFQQSGASILQIASTVYELDAVKDEFKSDPQKLEVLFTEMIQMCLWGNATDLSLLTHISQDDIKHLQSVGKDAQAARKQFILKDDQAEVWKHVQSLRDARIDFVLDNAGFELFTDLVFADFLVTYTPNVSRVCFHPKLIPWFVSDVTPPDFVQAFAFLLDGPFAHLESTDLTSPTHLKHMVSRWQKYLDQGIFSLSVPLDTPLGGSTDSTMAEFWSTPHPYWNMRDLDSQLHEELTRSGLVIFKAIIASKLLLRDVAWPAWTSVESALGPLAGSFPLLSLRTNKADVVVGVDRNTVEHLENSGEKWRVDGRYALISFLPSK
ncbi:hypothetical protein K443DRAFT_82818 [Laccaria amethystina LaAM-08-1]|uniref:Sugar phosphate phosphatase n=1 Tax=Laccaria amethystina LaAM-08-1 TaxID=1095629 RepID=A0A0C9YNF1_9AGAR|nr:hypothetical protein K443DRAFT_82818 [Laccaria amethystina LaAM-08-1]